MNRRKQSLEEIQELVRSRGKKFVTIDEGAALYSMGKHRFRDLAEDAKAIYRIGRNVLVNTVLFEEYLEVFREF